MDTLTVGQDGPHTPDVRGLLQSHFDLMWAGSPAASCHVLEPDQLLERGAVLLAARDGAGTVLGIGALAQIAPAHGELKSMHTAAAARGRGVAQAVLAHLLDAARQQGMTRTSLETGSSDMFAPARALYLRNGFTLCPPFADYVSDPLSVFMTRAL